MKRFLSLLVLICVVISALSTLSGCKGAKSQKAVKTAQFYEYFDTVSVVSVYKEVEDAEFDKVKTVLREELDKYHKLFDIYYEYAGVNNLKTVNKKAGKSWVEVDPELVDFLIYCKETFTLTEGKTNIALGSVLKIWHNFRAQIEDGGTVSPPDGEELARAAEHTDLESLEIDSEGCRVYISDPLLSLDVGAIGKGYATERIAEKLSRMGLDGYVLNIGGNIRTIGKKPDGSGWVTGITNPNKSSDKPFVARITLGDTSIVTSGNYERYVTVDGVRYHHIIDPDTLYPAEQWSSVSVIVADSALADCLSTALFCMTYDEATELLEAVSIELNKEISALFVDSEGEIFVFGDIDFVK